MMTHKSNSKDTGHNQRRTSSFRYSSEVHIIIMSKSFIKSHDLHIYGKFENGYYKVVFNHLSDVLAIQWQVPGHVCVRKFVQLPAVSSVRLRLMQYRIDVSYPSSVMVKEFCFSVHFFSLLMGVCTSTSIFWFLTIPFLARNKQKSFFNLKKT